MNVIFTGKGTSGSWQIRGCQIARELEAKAIPMATADQMREADVVIGVKRIPDALLRSIQASGRPFVWDCVDAYPNRESGAWSREKAIDWCAEELHRLQPDVVIWPNQRMREDMGGGGKVVYHHHRPQIDLNPIRERIQTIGYEGSPIYLEEWGGVIAQECARIGASFLVNPERLADVDVVLALRGKRFQGYPHRHWKSQVKLSNAHGSGTPFIGQAESGYLEATTGAECWIDDASDLSRALDSLASRETRLDVQRMFLSAALPVQTVADQYREILCAFKS